MEPAQLDDDDATETSSHPKNDLLKLSDGGTSVNVYVKKFGSVAGFSGKKNGHYHSKGITWKSKGGSLSVTFHLLKGVEQLTTTGTAVTFSAVSNNEQTATFPDSSVDESFTVQFDDGSHDPQIIISPG